MPWGWGVGAGVLLLALVAALVLTVTAGSLTGDFSRHIRWYAVSWVLFAAAVWAVRRVPGRWAVFLLVAGAVFVPAAGLLALPTTSTDSYRYVWDGRVQAAGISPYAHAPGDPVLATLRDPWLFPRGTACHHPYRYPVHDPEGCTRINRPAVHTVYPPLAEAYFLVVHLLSPDASRHKALQAGGALLAVGTSLALLAALRGRGRDPVMAACWAWCPAVPLEAVNNAHVDVLGVLLTVLALGVVTRGRGALLGAAIAVKLVPALAVPGALSGLLAGGVPLRRRVRDAAAILVPAALVVALAYLPYALTSGGSVLGYLSGYLDEEGYAGSGGTRYALLRLLLPGAAAPAAALAVLAATALLVLRRAAPDRPWQGALVVTGVAFLAFTPGYPWYALLVVALVALDGRWEWLGVPLAGAAAYLGIQQDVGTVAYALAAIAVVTGAVVRRSRSSKLLERG
ncbi:glycosyltransferase 87 family protein [Nonomuraea sp. NPDC049419]|uniref:glycosyltransferase 87 family protein n=1 Tax=Nonomuraea sp. NPDC049419 TaxID=3155772 RepID=UPI00342D68E8